MNASAGVASLARYGIVVVLGLAIDLAVALCLARLFGWPLVAAAIGGFVVALALNYALFEFWAFRDAASRFSARRLGQTTAAALAALAVRAGVVWALDRRFGAGALLDAAVLVAGAGASFVVNFLLVRVVFARRAGS